MVAFIKAQVRFVEMLRVAKRVAVRHTEGVGHKRRQRAPQALHKRRQALHKHSTTPADGHFYKMFLIGFISIPRICTVECLGEPEAG